jgi:hypothetical protein
MRKNALTPPPIQWAVCRSFTSYLREKRPPLWSRNCLAAAGYWRNNDTASRDLDGMSRRNDFGFPLPNLVIIALMSQGFLQFPPMVWPRE